MIEFALGAYLLTRDAVTDIVGTAGVYGDKAPQKKAPPFIVYEQSGGDGYYHTQGASGLAEATINLTCKAASYHKAHQLYEVLRDELDGFRGDWGTTVIRSAFLSAPVNVSQPDAKGSDTSENAVKGSLVVNYFRAVPTFGEEA